MKLKPLETFSEAVKFIGWLKPATDNVFLHLRMSNDGGSTFRAGASDYQWSLHYGTAAADGNQEDTADSEIQVGGDVGNAAGEFVAFELPLIGLRSGSISSQAIALVTSKNVSGAYVHLRSAGMVKTEEVNDAVRFLFSSGNMADGEITMYGYPAP